MRIGRLGFASIILLSAWGGRVIAADLESTCQISDEEQKQLGCVCVGPLGVQPASVALLDQIKGEVLKSDPAGYSPVTQPTPLVIGDSVLVKDRSNALLVMGLDCQREIGPNASLVVRQTDHGCACAALLEEKPKAAALHDPALLAGLAVGGGILLLHHLPPPVSP
jgi:hypothetical protein